MNELIKIDKETNTCNARELWVFLESKQDFSNWIKNRIKKYEFEENIDFTVVNKNIVDDTSFSGTRKIIEYYISIEMAKELSMVENNKKGKEARKYFIECERKLKNRKQLTSAELILEQAKGLVENERKMKLLEKKQNEIENNQNEIKKVVKDNKEIIKESKEDINNIKQKQDKKNKNYDKRVYLLEDKLECITPIQREKLWNIIKQIAYLRSIVENVSFNTGMKRAKNDILNYAEVTVLMEIRKTEYEKCVEYATIQKSKWFKKKKEFEKEKTLF